ncbi:MAG: 16S rRNA (guanine(527)-N(7))-methyltransferase RsmG [Nitrospira sp.]|nr:16S rRNA (guanine(527)-N(7))-methyltransferase RsmG [Nitrospira sp.]
MEHEVDLEKLLIHSAEKFKIALTGDQCTQFMRYLSQLTYWNRTINLTSITNPREIVIKHFIDSLVSLATVLFPYQAKLIDVGTGAGFPGIPLKIVRPDLQVTLIESNKKKCSFLSSLIGTLRLTDIEVFARTVQEYQDHGDAHTRFITARAVRADVIHSELLSLALPTGKIVLYRTEPLILKDSPTKFVIEAQRKFDLPENAGERVITVLSPK